jgi:DNA replication protein DnaT
MSGDWLKLENITPNKFEIMQMADILNKNRQEVVGIFIDYLVWLNEQCDKAFIPASAQGHIDEKVNCPGFCNALQEVGWMNITETDLEIVKFDRHNGNTAKSRSQNNRRVANYRAKNKIEKGIINGELDVTHLELQNHIPEKRREENNSSVLEHTERDNFVK